MARPGFKPGWGRHPFPGRFDSGCLPPLCKQKIAAYASAYPVPSGNPDNGLPEIRLKNLTRSTVFFFTLLVCVNAAGWLYYVITHGTVTRGMPMIRTTTPLLIGGRDGDETRYVLPVGTTLYEDKSYPEGFTRYLVYFNHKGPIDHETVTMEPKYGGSVVVPQWLESIDAVTLNDIFKRFPLSRRDVAAAVKANDISRDDLIEIIGEMPE